MNYLDKIMKFKLTLILLALFTFQIHAQDATNKFIEKEITLITDCEITSVLAETINLKTLLDLDIKPEKGDSAYALIKNVFINDKGYRSFEILTFPLKFNESLFSDNKLIKHFTVSGDLTYIKNHFKVGESIQIEWKATTIVEHSKELTENDRLIYEGFFIDGLPVSQEIIVDDKMQTKTVTNNILGYKHGVETIYEDGIKITELNWFMGELNGFATNWFLNGKISSKIFYIDNTKEGHAASYYESGQLKKSIFYYGDKAHGQDYYYFESGKLMDDAQYKDGEYHGKVTKYYENGNIRFQQYRVDGISHGSYLRNYESGATEVRTNFLEGKLHGNYIDFYESGKKKSKGEYFNGSKVGKWLYWDKNGNKTKETFDK
jgi:antitoxin component YwqK of YwqJK toxin-antitoxin module